MQAVLSCPLQPSHLSVRTNVGICYLLIKFKFKIKIVTMKITKGTKKIERRRSLRVLRVLRGSRYFSRHRAE